VQHDEAVGGGRLDHVGQHGAGFDTGASRVGVDLDPA
jgi:hypothetical protein